MHSMQDTSGLRDRKRLETRARIQDAAITLFLAEGFDAVTLDQVAEAAGVSRRSLFNYFTSKEEMVLSAKADLVALIRSAIPKRPRDEPLLVMAENALLDIAPHFDDDRARATARMIHQTPSLRAWDAAKHEQLEIALAEALAERKGLVADDAEVRLTAIVCTAILRHATDRWLAAEDGDSPEVFGKAAFQALRDLTRA